MLKLRAAPAAQDVYDAIEVLRAMNAGNARKVPDDAPTGFVKKRWEKLVFTETGIDRRYYELCALSELSHALRSGDIWVQGSRQVKNFDEYLPPQTKFAVLRKSGELPIAISNDCEQYLQERLKLLEDQLALTNRMARTNDLPDAVITESGLKITPLDTTVPDAAQSLIDHTAQLLPHVKITELLMEVDRWTGFTRHFTHLKSMIPLQTRICCSPRFWPTPSISVWSKWPRPARAPPCQTGLAAGLAHPRRNLRHRTGRIGQRSVVRTRACHL